MRPTRFVFAVLAASLPLRALASDGACAGTQDPAIAAVAATVRSASVVSKPKTHRKVIPGTWGWDIDHNKVIGDDVPADVWVEHVDTTHRYLTAVNGGRFRIVHKAFDAITLGWLKKQKRLHGGRLSFSDGGGSLKPGAVLAIRTSKGTYAKARIVGFLPLSDRTFRGDQVLPADWPPAGAQEIEKYHLVLDWAKYPE